jgi:hypothetical protein
MKVGDSFVKILKNLIFPFVSALISIVLFFIFINPFYTYRDSFESLKLENEQTISVLTNNLKILEQVSANREKLDKLSPALKSLIPDSANASDLVGLIDKEANNFRFRSIEENRNVTGVENDQKRLIEVRFNGRSPGMVSSINFLNSLNTNQEKIIKISTLELTNVPDELYTRVSFNAFSIYASPLPRTSVETPLINLFENPKFNNLLNSF